MPLKAAERRAEILKILCRRRYETISVLAAEFNVSERTIRRDIKRALAYEIFDFFSCGHDLHCALASGDDGSGGICETKYFIKFIFRVDL